MRLDAQKMLDAFLAARTDYENNLASYEKCKKEKPEESKKCEELAREIEHLRHMENFMTYGETYHGGSDDIAKKIDELQVQLGECRHSKCYELRKKVMESKKVLKERSQSFQKFLKSLE